MRRPRKSINQINVVPYIDVMLVLLVIFMVTAPLIASGTRSSCRRSAAALVAPVQPLKVTLNSDRTLSLQDQQAGGPAVPVSRTEFVARIRSKQAKGAGPAGGHRSRQERASIRTCSTWSTSCSATT